MSDRNQWSNKTNLISWPQSCNNFFGVQVAFVVADLLCSQLYLFCVDDADVASKKLPEVMPSSSWFTCILVTIVTTKVFKSCLKKSNSLRNYDDRFKWMGLNAEEKYKSRGTIRPIKIEDQNATHFNRVILVRVENWIIKWYFVRQRERKWQKKMFQTMD